MPSALENLCGANKPLKAEQPDPAHGLCLAALRWHGYRSNYRYIVFQVLPHTLGLEPSVWRVLANCHDVRNLGEYEGDLNVDERLVTDLVAACSVVAARVRALPAITG